MRKSLFWLITLNVALLLSCLPFGNVGLRVRQFEGPKISGLPLVRDPFSICFAGGYVGAMVDPGRSFQLLNTEEELVLSLEAETGGRFFYLEMASPNGVVLLGKMFGEAQYFFSAYTLGGERIFENVHTTSVMRSSPSGQYYYTTNDFILRAGNPKIYDEKGQLIASLAAPTRWWELSAVDDSTVVFQRDNKVQKLSVPEMVVLSQVTVESLRPPLSLNTTVSPCGDYFAYSEAEKITVCDFESGSSWKLLIENPEDPFPDCQLLLSREGSYVIAYDSFRPSPKLYVFKKSSHGYTRLLTNHTIPLGTEVSGYARKSFIDGNVCVLNFLQRGRQGPEFVAFIFDIRSVNEHGLEGNVVDGLVSLSDDEPESYFFYRVRRGSQRSVEFNRLMIVGGLHE